MWRFAIRDYFEEFRWKNIKAFLENTQIIWSILLWGFTLPTCWQIWEKREYWITYYCIAWTVLYTMCSIKLHQLVFPKMMYLSPIKRADRKEYMWCRWWVRIFADMIIAGIGIGILAVLGLIDWVSVCTLLIWNVSFNLMLGGSGPEVLNEYMKNESDNRGRTLIQIVKVVILVLMVISLIVVPLGIGIMICSDTPVAVWVKWLFAGISVLMQIPIIVWMMAFWKTIVDKTMSYEKCCL